MLSIYDYTTNAVQQHAKLTLDTALTNLIGRHNSCHHPDIVSEMMAALVQGQTALGYFEDDGYFITIEIDDVPLLYKLACKHRNKLTWVLQFPKEVHRALAFQENIKENINMDPTPNSPNNSGWPKAYFNDKCKQDPGTRIPI